MSNTPDDLVPLPTAPYDERPAELPLDVQECRTAIWLHKGNVSKAAERLRVTSMRLRNFIRRTPVLARECEEAREQVVDRAEEVVVEALDDPDERYTMARFVLQSQGKARGWGQGSMNVKIGEVKGPVIIQWADGSAFGQPDDIKTIEGTVEAAE